MTTIYSNNSLYSSVSNTHYSELSFSITRGSIPQYHLYADVMVTWINLYSHSFPMDMFGIKTCKSGSEPLTFCLNRNLLFGPLQSCPRPWWCPQRKRKCSGECGISLAVICSILHINYVTTFRYILMCPELPVVWQWFQKLGTGATSRECSAIAGPRQNKWISVFIFFFDCASVGEKGWIWKAMVLA